MSVITASLLPGEPRRHRRKESANYHHWTAPEDRLLRRTYALGLSVSDVATQIGVSPEAAQSHAAQLGLQHRRGQRSVADRFMDHVSPEPNSGCWLWDGSCDRRGYGQLRIARRVLKYATHVALELDGRPVSDGLYACHHCDTPACVNPAHLFIGSQRENMADSARKGRASPPPIAKRGQGRKQFCVRGHPLSGDNLYYPPGNDRYRACRACLRIRKAALNARLKAARAVARTLRCS